MHICPDEFKAAVAVVAGIALVPHYCRWCWYKVRSLLTRPAPPPIPPARIHEPEKYPLQWRE